ncbi:MAG: glycosyltransferase [Myxococcota bacterium]|jgi:ceramide glucosyltransferase
MNWLTLTLLTLAAVGFVALTLQRVGLAAAVRGPVRPPTRRPGISILKPLCGVDDALEENLASFAVLDYPRCEVLLGVKDTRDPAYTVACRAAARAPRRFRVVLQQGEAGLNPKVNQLVTLARAARHDLLLVSDSNSRLAPGALQELAALFEDPRVACVSNPVSGAGHESFGALLDNLHLASGIGAGQLAAKAVAGKDLVVGKSMALSREALDALGGFAAYADVLAEDYVIGQDITRKLGRTVAIARTPVLNVAVRRSVSSFFQRYVRWSVIHRTAITLPTYLSQALLNPWPLLVLVAVLKPGAGTAGLAAAGLLLKAAIDVSAARALGCGPLGVKALGAVAVKDLLLFIAWCNGLVSRTVTWRGTRLRVTHGSRLVRPGAALPEVAEPAPVAGMVS